MRSLYTKLYQRHACEEEKICICREVGTMCSLRNYRLWGKGLGESLL